MTDSLLPLACPPVSVPGAAAPPTRRRPLAIDSTSTAPATPGPPTARPRLPGERHAADYAILVIVVALTAIGILMVYSSSAMKSYSATDDPFSIVAPQVGWAGARHARDGRDDAGRLPLPSVRLVPAYVFALALLVLVFVPA